ncbi:MAG: precorrin-6y C5,15-methyltransferase (decarboxylating) subunit CbiE [Lachnospiraceae bacterium]|nr:precorrin-6y C5,15-methyltransferase (decarboxylating) subunit CbiE [Lachnospiraceae bacterium]
MKRITVIGAGTASGMISLSGLDKLKRAGLVIGAARLTEMYENYIGAEIYSEYRIDMIKRKIDESEERYIALLVSGDTGFYSLTEKILEVFDDENYDVEVIPGISSVSSLSAAVGISWQDAALCSMHGRDCNIVEYVRRNHSTFVLTGGNISEVSDRLIKAGYGNLKVYVGSNLDSGEEKIISTDIAGLAEKTTDKLSLLLIINDEANEFVAAGMEDEIFARGDVPMTKSEVRAVIISKLQIRPEDTCVDIGAGTGSVTAEMALAAWKGKVYAIERKAEAIELIKENLNKLHIGNTTVIEGEAPGCFDSLDEERENIMDADRVFIGGSGGNIRELIGLWENAHMVITAIALETLGEATDELKKRGRFYKVVQINVAKSRKTGELNLMTANNPVNIIYTV